MFFYPVYPDFEIRQDSLLRLSPPQSDSLRLNVPVEKLQIDRERAQEIIDRIERRDREIVTGKTHAAAPSEETQQPPADEIDLLPAAYQYIGRAPRITFPDTFSLTILERRFQPPASARAPDIARVNTAVTVVPSPGFPGEVRTDIYPSVITFFILCGLILPASIKFRFGGYLWQSFMSFFSYRQACRMYEERRESDRVAALYSHILFALAVGIYASVALPFFGNGPLWGSYALSVLFFSPVAGLLYLLKAGVWKMLGAVFMLQSLAETYIYNMFLYNRNIGLLIFPLVAVIPFVPHAIVPYAIYGVIAIFAGSYLLKMRRLFRIILAHNVPMYGFILYLCTLEILPLLLLIKTCSVLNDYLTM